MQDGAGCARSRALAALWTCHTTWVVGRWSARSSGKLPSFRLFPGLPKASPGALPGPFFSSLVLFEDHCYPPSIGRSCPGRLRPQERSELADETVLLLAAVNGRKTGKLHCLCRRRKYAVHRVAVLAASEVRYARCLACFNDAPPRLLRVHPVSSRLGVRASTCISAPSAASSWPSGASLRPDVAWWEVALLAGCASRRPAPQIPATQLSRCVSFSAAVTCAWLTDSFLSADPTVDSARPLQTYAVLLCQCPFWHAMSLLCMLVERRHLNTRGRQTDCRRAAVRST